MESHDTFHLCQAVERAFITHVLAVVDSPYLTALQNTNTSRYGDSILKLLQHTLTTYGHITPQQLKAKEMEICNMQFKMSFPIDIVFNAIDDLLKLSEYALIPNSSSQAVNLAYVVFAKNLILLQDLWPWNCHSAEFCTWDAMKIHLRAAQHDLISLPVAGQMYNQELQANLVQRLQWSTSHSKHVYSKHVATIQLSPEQIHHLIPMLPQ